mmetsp:Transcript_28063/g.90628  ORF Transcript_28063/g.90628 Transcript_28063/m.90628 type:complete len:213 (+) Transcript_28063:212-850(+)
MPSKGRDERAARSSAPRNVVGRPPRNLDSASVASCISLLSSSFEKAPHARTPSGADSSSARSSSAAFVAASIASSTAATPTGLRGLLAGPPPPSSPPSSPPLAGSVWPGAMSAMPPTAMPSSAAASIVFSSLSSMRHPTCTRRIELRSGDPSSSVCTSWLAASSVAFSYPGSSTAASSSNTLSARASISLPALVVAGGNCWSVAAAVARSSR